jgi:hypothetical protein
MLKAETKTACCTNVAHGAVGDKNTSECVRKAESFARGTCCGAISAIMAWDRSRQETVGVNSDRHSRRHATTVRIHPVRRLIILQSAEALSIWKRSVFARGVWCFRT